MEHHVVLRVKHFKNAPFYHPTKCPFANALTEHFPNAHIEEWVYRSYVFTDYLTIYSHQKYDYDKFIDDRFYANDWWVKMFRRSNKPIRTIKLIPTNGSWRDTDDNLFHITNGRLTNIPINVVVTADTIQQYGYSDKLPALTNRNAAIEAVIVQSFISALHNPLDCY